MNRFKHEKMCFFVKLEKKKVLKFWYDFQVNIYSYLSFINILQY